MSRIRLLFVISALAAMATMLAACGGDDNGNGGGEDPQKVLDQTFSADNAGIDSGNLNIKLSVEASGEDSGSLDADLSGPFENQGEGKVPKFDLTANVSASGQGQDVNFDGGLISTGDAAFVGYQGSDYDVPASLFNQFKSSIEQAAGQQQQNQGSAQQLFEQLGIEDPKSLLTNLSNEGTEDVEGTETTHISGDLDVQKLIDGLKNLVGGASALGALGGSTDVPDPEQLDQVADAVKEAHFDIYSGTDDQILRRLTVALSIEPPEGSTSKVDVNFDFSVGDVNEPQTVEAPSGTKPFRDLLQELGVPAGALEQLGGGLGGVGGDTGGGGGGGGGGPATPALPGSTPDADAAQKYLNCIAKAESAADLQDCQSLAP